MSLSPVVPSESCTVPPVASAKIGGRSRPARDKIVPRKFAAVAKLLWPENTAAHIAALAGSDVRTGKRWLRGEHEPPPSVIIACIQEMLRPIEQ